MDAELGKNRIEALSDGIFAIAMTLLVLELRVPHLPPNASNVEVLPALMKLWPHLISYAASFISLGVFWVAHHNLFHAVRRADRMLLCQSILFFMLVSFLPFSTSVLNAFRQTQVAPVFFGTNVALLGWMLHFQWAYARSQPGMLADHASPQLREQVSARLFTVSVFLTLTVLVCYWSVEISVSAYLLLLPFYLIPTPGGGERRLPEGGTLSMDVSQP